MLNDNIEDLTEDDIYLAKMTMDEVGADIEEHGHVAVTDENRTQDPFTTKGSLANALDEALDFSNPNYDPTNEAQGEVEGVTQDPQNEVPRSDTEIKPDDTTMDKAPEVPETIANEKTAKDTLSEALDSVFAMDAVTEVPGEADDDAHQKWENEEIKKRVPKVPKSIGGEEADSNGLVYLEYTFTVDPSKYRSVNYQPIANAGGAGGMGNAAPTSASNDKVDEEVLVEEKVEEPTAKEEQQAAKEANEDKAEHDSLGKPIEGDKGQSKEEKEAEDEAIAKGLIDFATFIDGSSFLCNDEVSGIDYSKIAMDAGPKKVPTKQNCKTTFAQCRAKNPLYCRFHGPKLLEKDIKTAISAALGKGCVVSVTKDKGNKNPLAFRLTVGCPPQMKKDVEQTVHWYMTNIPGISSPEEYKDLGNGKETLEFEMDVLKADEPPKKSETKAQVAEYEVEQATAANKKMPVVGETPPSVEKKAAKAEVSHKFGEEEPAQEASQGGEEENAPESQETKADETDAENVDAQEVLASMKGSDKEVPNEEDNQKGIDLNKQFSDLADKAAEQELFYNPDFKAKYDSINNSGDEMEKKIENLSALLDEFSNKGSGNEADGDGSKPLKSFEDEFNAALMEYPDIESGLTNSDSDAKNIEINEAFTKAYLAHNEEGMKSAIDAMKKLVSDVKGIGGDTSGETSANASSGFHFVDDAVMKMTSEIDDLAHENPELISGDDHVSAMYYAAQTALNGLDLYKQGLDEIDAKLKEMENGGFETGASGVVEKMALEDAKKTQQEYYDDAKVNAEISVKDFKNAVENAKKNMVDGIKGINAGMVEDIVKTTAMAIFPNGKPNGVDSVVDMIDALHEDMTSLANEKLGEGGYLPTRFFESKKKNGLHEAYKAVSYASLEFDAAVKSFKELIDGAKTKERALKLKEAVKDIGEKGQALKDAFAAYKNAVEMVKKDITAYADIQAAKKKMQQSSEEASPSDDDIHEAAKVISKSLGHADEEDWPNYYEKQLSDILSGNGYPKNVDKISSEHAYSRRHMAQSYLNYLGEGDGFDLVKAALQKIIDMPKWGEKKKLTEAEGNGDLSGEVAKFVGADTEPSGKLKSMSHDAHMQLMKTIDEAVSADGHFTNFKLTPDYDSKELLLSMQKKQKVGFNKDEDVEEVPTAEEEVNIEEALKKSLGKVGLMLKPNSGISSGATVEWVIQAKPKKKSSGGGGSSATAAEIDDFVSKGFEWSPAYWKSTIADILNPDIKAMKMDAGQVKQLKKAMEKFPPGNKIVSLLEEGMVKKGLGGEVNKSSTPASSDSKAAIKAKIAAMSVKEKMEKSIPLLEKKIKAEPSNEKWKKMLAQAKAYLASHKE